MAYHEAHDARFEDEEEKLLAEISERLNGKGKSQRATTLALAVAAFSLLVAFVVVGVVIYSSRDLAGRLSDFQLEECIHGNASREQIKLGQRILRDLIVAVRPGLSGPVAVEFDQARRQLEAGLSRLDAVDCQLVVPR